MRIYTDHNEVAVNAIQSQNGKNVEGHVYQFLAGSHQGSLEFQLGPVGEVGVNGVTNEVVLAALIHRINHLNKLFPCRENALAITKLEEALMWLEARTANRIKRGVEGSNAL